MWVVVSYLPYLALVALGWLTTRNVARYDGPVQRIAFGSFAALAIALLAFTSTGRGTPFGDFDKAYYPAGRNIVSAPQKVYECGHADGLCFVNPPVVAILFAPIALLPLPFAHAVVFVTGIVAVIVAIWMILHLCGTRPPARYQVIALVMLNGPLFYSLRLGNLTHVVLLLVVVAVTWLVRGEQGRAGALLAIAAVLKPPLLIWLPYFVLRRRVRAGVAMTAALVAMTGISVVLFGWSLHLAWARQFVLGSSGHPLGAYNVQSIAGFLVRFTTSGTLVDWRPVEVGRLFYLTQAILSAGVVALGLAAGVVAGEPKTAPAALREDLILLCVMLLVSPLSWTHYYCLLLLPLCAFVSQTIGIPQAVWWQRSTWTAALLVSLPVMLWVPSGRFSGPLVARILLSHYVFGAALLLTILATAAIVERKRTRWGEATADPVLA